MKRHEWEFGYSAEKIAIGAEAQLANREERRVFWQKQYDEYLEQLRSNGIEVSESAALVTGGTGAAYSGGFGPQVMINPDYQRKLTECHLKIREHLEAARKYDEWIKVLRAQRPDHHLELNFDDWEFFFGDHEAQK